MTSLYFDDILCVANKFTFIIFIIILKLVKAAFSGILMIYFSMLPCVLFRLWKMTSSNFKIRAFLLYDFKNGCKAAESARRIRNVCGEDSVTDGIARFWFRRFKTGNENLEDEPRQGRPLAFEDDELHACLQSNPRATCETIAELLNCEESTVQKRLHAIGFVNKLDKWVPHRLTPENKFMRLSICTSLLARNDLDPFTDRIVTCDEKWVLHDNNQRSRQWVPRGKDPGTTAKLDLHPKRLLMTVWWNSRGIIHLSYLPHGQTITAAVYSSQIQEVHQKLLQTHPALVNRKGVVLLQDNARPHTASMTRATLKDVGWEILPHPPYSPDISPCDYYLFLSLSNFLASKRFSTDDELKTAIASFFDSKDQAFYLHGMRLLVERWQKVVDADGDYFVD